MNATKAQSPVWYAWGHTYLISKQLMTKKPITLIARERNGQKRRSNNKHITGEKDS